MKLTLNFPQVKLEHTTQVVLRGLLNERTSFKNIRRLARFLKLEIENLSDDEVFFLVKNEIKKR